MPERRFPVIAKNAIWPSPPRLWADSDARLAEAQAALQALSEKREQRAYEAAWLDLVNAIDFAWNTFYAEGCRVLKRPFRDAANPVIDARDGEDPVLTYMRVARNHSLHRGVAGIEWLPPTYEWGGDRQNGRAFIRDIVIYNDGTYSADARSIPGGDDHVPPTLHPGRPTLLPLSDGGKGKKKERLVDPPSGCGHLFDGGAGPADPQRVAASALGKYEYASASIRKVLSQPINDKSLAIDIPSVSF